MGKGIDQQLDSEWIQLILEAKQMGMDLDTVRDFLKKTGEKEGTNNFSYKCHVS